jgi:hypothetical protein
MNQEIIEIKNIGDYIQEIINGNLYLTPKKKYITEIQLLKLNLKHSTIVSCKITIGDEVISMKKNYQSLLIDIWKRMLPTNLLLNTTYNFKLGDEGGKLGYNYCDQVKMSFQSKNSKGAIKELIHMVKYNKYNIDIAIQTNGNIILFKI